MSIEYERQWKGHHNVRTIKEINYFGPNDQYIISGTTAHARAREDHHHSAFLVYEAFLLHEMFPGTV